MMNMLSIFMQELVNILVYHNLPKSILSLRTTTDPINNHFETTEHPLTILVFWRERTKGFSYKHYISTILFIQQALVIQSLLKFYLLLIVTTLFLFNGLFIVLSSVIVWAALFTLMVLFNLICSWPYDWRLPLSQVWICLF